MSTPEPSDPPPANLAIGAINPFALVEALTGKKFDWTKPESAKILSDVLETDYAELFDMQFNSPLYAGLKLNSATQTAEPLKASDVKILTPDDRLTPALNAIKKLSDLKSFSGANFDGLEVNQASVHNGKLSLVLPAPAALSKKITNTAVTKPIFDLAVATETWPPPGTTWKDVGDFFKDSTEFNDPIQGPVGNCYLIAALAAIAWADPFRIIQRTRATSPTGHTNGIQFFSKPHRHNGPTGMVEVTDSVLVRNNSNIPLFCRSYDMGEIWPAVYEKAYAKWTTSDKTDTPNIIRTAGGDPVAAIAQITNGTPFYYGTKTRTADAILTIVRGNCFGNKTIHPMVAWTFAASPGNWYVGPNIAGNHAYTILGWATRSGRSYIVLRNPWGVKEPSGSNTLQGVVTFLDGSFWRPISTIGDDGIFALEINSFKTYYAGLGFAK